MSRVLAAAFLAAVAATEPQPYVGHFTLPYRGPVAYSDRATETMFYVESDGRHVSAIRFDGNVAWTRDPYVEAHLERAPYRVKHRRIVSIGRTDPAALPEGFDRKKLFVSIAFDSTDFGIIDTATGKFTYLGRD
jgi:hypothetical protein